MFSEKLKFILVLVILFHAIDTFAETKSTADASSESVYVMGVFPFISAREIEKVFSPMALEFSRVLGKKVLFRSAPSYREFSERLIEGRYDFAFVQPFDYIHIADDLHYVPLAARKELLRAVLVTQDNKRLKNVSDYRGKIIALPPKVAAVSRLIVQFFREKGLEPGKDIKYRHFSNHLSCMHQVIIHAADACGTAPPPLRYFNKKMKRNLVVVAKTKGIPHALFAAHPRVSQQDRKMITRTLVSFSETELGKKILLQGKLKPFVPITDEAYDVVRKLDSRKL